MTPAELDSLLRLARSAIGSSVEMYAGGDSPGGDFIEACDPQKIVWLIDNFMKLRERVSELEERERVLVEVIDAVGNIPDMSDEQLGQFKQSALTTARAALKEKP